MKKRADWWRQAAIYQIYPRSFKDSNADGIGDIKGITSKIDYLKSLSLDAVWLSPFYPSELADGGYDVADYRNVDPRLGTLKDFDKMLKALHKADIAVFVDIVPNHSSNMHPWFQEALKSQPGSPARNRYIFRDGRGKNGELPPSDEISHFAPSAWTRTTNADGTPGQWYMHLFAPEQPDFNWDNREVQLDFLKTLRFWADRGVDGFRVDVAHAMKKDFKRLHIAKKSMNAFKIAQDGSDILFDRNEVHEIFREWRQVFNEYDPPRVAVAEAYVQAKRRMLYARPDELGQAFNFDLLGEDFDARRFKKVISDNIRLAKSEGSSSTWVLDNHDRIRHATRYGLPKKTNFIEWLLTDGKSAKLDRALGLARANAATMMLLALPGCTYIYQGEELGLFEVEDIPRKDLQDPMWFRNVVPQMVKGKVSGLALIHTDKGRDGCRVPLPWDSTKSSFGFGQEKSHLPQPQWFANHAVDKQDGIKGSTLSLYRDALALRKKLQTDEELQWIPTTNAEVIHFARPNGWQCIMNFNAKSYKLPAGKVVLSSTPIVGGKIGANTTIWLTD
jgi:alpha-glucosidase